MKPDRIRSGNFKWIFPAIAAVAAVFYAVSLRYDFFHDLNDDAVICALTGGFYTGLPEANNIQMQWPIGAFLALLYHAARTVPWYGLLMCTLQALCCFLVIFRATVLFDSFRARSAVFPAVSLVTFVLLLPHLVYVQYTFVCALLSGTASFLLLTGKSRSCRTGAVCLQLTAFLLRSEMMLLTLPLFLLAVLFAFRAECAEADKGGADSREKPERSAADGVAAGDSDSGGKDRRACLMKYVTLLSALVAGLMIFTGVHGLAYGGEEWRTFTGFFDERTRLYDFETLPEYEAHRAFYERIGVAESTWTLLENYNFGLDEAVDAVLLEEIADYAASLRHAEEAATLPALIRGKISGYLYRLRHPGFPVQYEYPQTDAPWNLLTLLLYAAVLAALFRHGAWWKTALLFACRTGLWGYILYHGRAPVRITQGLYIAELLLLAGLVLPALAKGEAHSKGSGAGMRIAMAVCILCAVTAAVYLPAAVRVTDAEQAAREETASVYRPFYAHLQSHPENFYFLDVYTSISVGNVPVPYAEKLFAPVSIRTGNQDICGGWVCKSPLYEQKLMLNGFSSMRGALLREHVYFVQDVRNDTSWLRTLYAEKGEAVTVTQELLIGGRFAVYAVRPAF